MSIRQQIVDKIGARLAGILLDATATLETGEVYTYQSSLGDNVNAWRTRAFAPNEAEGVIYRDTTGTMADSDVTSHEDHTLTIEVLAAAGKGFTAASARKWLEDILAAVGVDRTWGGLAFDTQPISARLEVEEQGLHLVGASIVLEIRYRTKHFRL